MFPISEVMPLSECKHYIAAVEVPEQLHLDGESIENFYLRLGRALLGTVVDGDCGLDLACMMLSWPQTLENRNILRKEVSDYLIERIEEPWMQDLMVVCEEIRADDLALFRSCGLPPTAVGEIAAIEVKADPEENPAEDEKLGEDKHCSGTTVAVDCDKATAALKWATGLSELGVIESLRKALPEAVLTEQICLYDARAIIPKSKPPTKIVCQPANFSSRQKVAQALGDYISSRGLELHDRKPRNFYKQFLEDSVVFRGKPLKDAVRALRRWYASWLKAGAVSLLSRSGGTWHKHSCSAIVALDKRKRRQGLQGKPPAAPLVRDQLFEWFIAMRYAIDWKALATKRRSQGRKCITRFPRSLLKAKVHQLVEAYCCDSLVNGLKPQAINPTTTWFRRWEAEYGVSLRAPNRKYKCPKWIQLERMQLWWITLFRIRALCQEIFGLRPRDGELGPIALPQ